MNYVSFKLELFTQDKAFPFFIQYGYHEEELFLHTHADYHELTIVLSGSATHIVNNERYIIQKGDVFVVGNNLAHGFENPHNFKICNIMYGPGLIDHTARDIKQCAGYHALFVLEPYLSKDSHFTNRLRLPISTFESVNQLIASLVEEYESNHIGRVTLLEALFLNLVVTLTRAYKLKEEPPHSLLNLALSLAYINKHYAEPITIEMLAHYMHMSVRNYSRIFHQAYGVSPNNYIIQLRIQHAYALLRNPQLSVSEIAYLCGFQDSNYFSRQFKRSSGLTPTHYRHTLSETPFKNY